MGPESVILDPGRVLLGQESEALGADMGGSGTGSGSGTGTSVFAFELSRFPWSIILIKNISGDEKCQVLLWSFMTRNPTKSDYSAVLNSVQNLTRN